MAAVVDKDKCDGCGDCVEACPVNAIQLQNGKAVISDDCIDCDICVKTCPNQAISLMVKRPMFGGTPSRGNYGTGRRRYLWGRGRGRNLGGRRGVGYPASHNSGYSSSYPQGQVIPHKQEKEMLKEQTEALKSELEQIRERLKELESEAREQIHPS